MLGGHLQTTTELSRQPDVVIVEECDVSAGGAF
jgi:hypothetical protein